MKPFKVRGRRGVLSVRVCRLESGQWTAIISDDKGGLLDGDRELSADTPEDAARQARLLCNAILAPIGSYHAIR